MTLWESHMGLCFFQDQKNRFQLLNVYQQIIIVNFVRMMNLKQFWLDLSSMNLIMHRQHFVNILYKVLLVLVDLSYVWKVLLYDWEIGLLVIQSHKKKSKTFLRKKKKCRCFSRKSQKILRAKRQYECFYDKGLSAYFKNWITLWML